MIEDMGRGHASIVLHVLLSPEGARTSVDAVAEPNKEVDKRHTLLRQLTQKGLTAQSTSDKQRVGARKGIGPASPPALALKPLALGGDSSGNNGRLLSGRMTPQASSRALTRARGGLSHAAPPKLQPKQRAKLIVLTHEGADLAERLTHYAQEHATRVQAERRTKGKQKTLQEALHEGNVTARMTARAGNAARAMNAFQQSGARHVGGARPHGAGDHHGQLSARAPSKSSGSMTSR